MDDIENFIRGYGPISEDPESDHCSVDSTASVNKSNLPLPIFPRLKKRPESGFHESSRLCLEQIRDAMLHHRWEEAAEYMTFSSQILEDNTHNQEVLYKQLIWRMGIEILHHHPNSSLDDYNNIYERMKNSGVKQYLTLCLEQSFHRLLTGHFQEAKHTLALAESWRNGREREAQKKFVTLITAYRSLLDYILWSEKEKKSEEDFKGPEPKAMHNHFRQASAGLKEVLENPGVWDPFILSYVDMLEFYDKQEEALKVLNHYAYDKTFPPNPNAHLYLYQYLQRHDASPKMLLKVLKILHSVLPSHPLMIDYCALLLKCDKTKKALGVAVDMLDYACWSKNLDVWKTLTSAADKLQTEGKLKEAVSEVMCNRMDWWPALHFTTFHAAQDQREQPELRRLKVPLARLLCPDMKLRYCQTEEAT